MKLLKRISSEIYHFDERVKVTGSNRSMSGNCTGLRGDCSDLSGDCSSLSGDLNLITKEMRKENNNIEFYA